MNDCPEKRLHVARRTPRISRFKIAIFRLIRILRQPNAFSCVDACGQSRKRGLFGFSGMLLVILSSTGLFAQDLRDPQFMERAEAGFEYIFNMDYDRAMQVFVSLEKEYPRHPAPPLYQASILWLEEMLHRQDLSLNRFIYPSYFSRKTDLSMPPQKRDAFFRDLQRCEDLADAILQNKSRDMDARYFLGTSYGLRAAFAITIDHSLRAAFINGNKAFSYCDQLIKEDPEYFDAYLTVGTYEYIVGSVPWYLKWMAFLIGAHGSKQEGLEHLMLAAEKGPYVKNQAKLVAMVLFVREHRYAEALQLARYLNGRFPRSFLLALNVAQIEQLSGNKDQAAATFLAVEKQAEARVPNFDKLPLQAFRFNLGTELMHMGKMELAQQQFRKCIDDPQSQSREVALSHLRLGKILEWTGHPNEAIQEFQIVLSIENVEDSHNQAKQLLNKLQRR